MEKIKELAGKLKNIPTSITRRIEEGKALRSKLAIAQQENETDPTEENQANLQEILDFISDHEEDLIEDLETLVGAQTRAEEQAKADAITQQQQEAEKKAKRDKIIADEKAKKAKKEADLVAQAKQEAEAKTQADQAQKAQQEAEAKAKQEADAQNKKEKSGGGWGLVLGGALLLLSLGAINRFQK